jgi:hypothetical protein
MTGRAPTSVVLDGLLGREAPEHVTLGWLMGRLGDRSFGVVLLLLALLGLLPGVSAVAGVLLMVPAVQMILARPGPVFPRRVAARRFGAERLARLVRRVVPVLRYLERFIRPRWATPFEATKRVVGGVVLLLAASLLAAGREPPRPRPPEQHPARPGDRPDRLRLPGGGRAAPRHRAGGGARHARGRIPRGLGGAERDRLGAGHPVSVVRSARMPREGKDPQPPRQQRVL